MYKKILEFWNNLSITDRYKLLVKVYGENPQNVSVWTEPEEKLLNYLENNPDEMN